MKAAHLKNQAIEALVLRYQTGKENDSFGEIYTRYYPNLFAYCLKITGSRADAYDLTTDTFIRAAEKIYQLSAPENFASWLFRIAHNKCMNHKIAARRNRCMTLDQSFQLAVDTSAGELSLEKEESLVEMEKLVNRLPALEKEILVEKYINGKSIKELECKYHLSASAVKMRLSRAKHKVAKSAA